MWSTFTLEEMHVLSQQLFKPLELMANYSLLEYLVVFYWPRRRELRVLVMFLVGAMGVACLVPFARNDDNLVSHLNDISEACCVVTFLLQITIVGHDLNKKIKFPSIRMLTRVAEALIAIDLALIVASSVAITNPGLLGAFVEDQLPNIVENATLLFIFAFRVYCLVAVSKSWRDVWRERQVELVWYFLFATHELPFMALEAASGMSWESAQSLYNRLTIAACLWVTVNSKIKSRRSSVEHLSAKTVVAVQRRVSTAGMFKGASSPSVVYAVQAPPVGSTQ